MLKEGCLVRINNTEEIGTIAQYNLGNPTCWVQIETSDCFAWDFDSSGPDLDEFNITDLTELVEVKGDERKLIVENFETIIFCSCNPLDPNYLMVLVIRDRGNEIAVNLFSKIETQIVLTGKRAKLVRGYIAKAKLWFWKKEPVRYGQIFDGYSWSMKIISDNRWFLAYGEQNEPLWLRRVFELFAENGLPIVWDSKGPYCRNER